jgi:uncharacterized Ntn-hydrolase superfamily protein
MKMGAIVALTLAGLSTPALAMEPVATFSIVARDPETGDLGVAVESKFFAVGAVVPWARSGVGAIATQAFANTTFGPRGLMLLEHGHGAPGVLDSLLASDSGAARRQVGIVDASGQSKAHTGIECQLWAGHRTGPGYSVQGNILTGENVVAAMERAFLESRGPLAGRLITALEAGQAAGGDSRGQQSAAVLVVRAGAGYGGFNDRYCDLRVDDHARPIEELRRLYQLWLPNALVLEGYQLVESGRFDEAVARGEAAIAADPQSPEGYYHTACYLARAGRGEASLARLSEAITRDPSIAQRATTDPDFDSVRGQPRYRQLTGGGSPVAAPDAGAARP